MRGLPDWRAAETAPSGSYPRPTVSARAPMCLERVSGGKAPDTTTDAPTPNQFHVRSAGMAHAFSAGARGDV